MKKVAILVVLTLAIMVISGTERNSISSAAEKDVGIQLVPEKAHNIQETVFENSDEGITDNAREFMLRNDISIEEIHDLKVSSKAEIYQRLGEPHGSVGGGSFHQFHYILENGDIVIFSSSELDNACPSISIYNKNGDLKNIISDEVE